ncbi:MAG: hypothetical protein PHF84_04450, partial [bacterium]|nr:hypothetical protein [bacterium]
VPYYIRPSPPITYSLKDSQDLYDKLTIDYNELLNEVNSRSVFNFVVTAYHLIEWMKKDKRFAFGDIQDEISEIKNHEYYKICRDLANASKHFELRNPSKKVKSTSVSQGFGVGRYGAGPFGSGEEEVTIELNDGRKIDILELAGGLMTIYDKYFTKSEIDAK